MSKLKLELEPKNNRAPAPNCNQHRHKNQSSQLGTALEPTPQSNQIQLRPYQQAVVKQVYGLIRSGVTSVVLIAVMGSGKTVIAAWIMRDAAAKGRRVVFLVSLTVLLDQTANTLRSLGVRCSVLQGDRQFDPEAPVVVASLQTIAARLRKGKQVGEILGAVDLVVVDESHVAAFQDAYDRVIEAYPQATALGLTATPWRLSKKEYLGQKFDRAVVALQPPEVIKLGGALPCRGFTLKGALELDQLSIRNGDYSESDIATQACRPEALQVVFREWKRLASDRPTLYIGATVDQAWLAAGEFERNGVRAAVIVGSTPRAERLQIFEKIKPGQVQVICSVGCLTAGFDLPAISAILYVRATKSRALFHQSAGRGSRPHPGKTNYLLLDFGGNLKRFGNPMAQQNYDISQPQQEEPPPITKTCPQCFAEVNQFAAVCSECGYEFCSNEPEDELEDFDPAIQLNEFLDAATRSQLKQLRLWKKQAFEFDRGPDSAVSRFVDEYGFTPPADWLVHSCLRRNASAKRRTEFALYLRRHSLSNRWAEQWLQHHLTIEFGDSPPQPDCFEVLGLNEGADWVSAKARYQQLIQDEPDEQRIQELNQALAAVRSEVVS